MMKKILNILSVFLVTLLLVTSCESDPIIFDGSKGVVGFSSSSLVVQENGTGNIMIYLGGETGLAATDVTVEVDITGIETPAILGTDFTLSATTVNAVVGENIITVNPVDNNDFGGPIMFRLKIISNSKNYETAVQDEILVTINDDDHPLIRWIGIYDVDAPSFTVPGAWDEAWVVETSPVVDNPYQLSFVGIGLSGTSLIGTFDTDAMTVTIAPGQDIGLAYADWGYDTPGEDEITVYYGYEDLTYDTELDLVGTIFSNGNMQIDGWCSVQAGAVWDVFNTTWTKQVDTK